MVRPTRRQFLSGALALFIVQTARPRSASAHHRPWHKPPAPVATYDLSCYDASVYG